MITPAEKIKRCGLFSSSGRSSQMASKLTLVLFQRVRCFEFNANACDAHLTCTFVFHSCVSRARTFTVRFFVWRMPTCHNGPFYTDEGLCAKCLTFLRIFNNLLLFCNVTHHFSISIYFILGNPIFSGPYGLRVTSLFRVMVSLTSCGLHKKMIKSMERIPLSPGPLQNAKQCFSVNSKY